LLHIASTVQPDIYIKNEETDTSFHMVQTSNANLESLFFKVILNSETVIGST